MREYKIEGIRASEREGKCSRDEKKVFKANLENNRKMEWNKRIKTQCTHTHTHSGTQLRVHLLFLFWVNDWLNEQQHTPRSGKKDFHCIFFCLILFYNVYSILACSYPHSINASSIYFYLLAFPLVSREVVVYRHFGTRNFVSNICFFLLIFAAFELTNRII